MKKPVMLEEDVHLQLKVLAATQGKKIGDYANELIKKIICEEKRQLKQAVNS